MNIQMYKKYITYDEWSSKDFTNKRNETLNKTMKISFSQIPERFKPIVKIYIYSSLNKYTFLTCKSKLRYLTEFILYVDKVNGDAKDFTFIEASHIIEFIEYLKDKNLQYKTKNKKILNEVRCIINTLQKLYPQYVSTINIDFILRRSNKVFKVTTTKNNIKYIPECVIAQFDEQIETINNKIDLLIAKTFRATGLRCNEIFRLKYDTVIYKDEDQYSIVLEHTSKTRILDRHLPIDKTLGIEIEEFAETVRAISNSKTNPNKYLFIYTQGRNKYKRIGSEGFIKRLNKWAEQNEIRDESGMIYRFSSHMFRHTIASELVNSKTELGNIKKYLGHKSENMTLEYAHINMRTIASECRLIHKYSDNLYENLGSTICIEEDIIELFKKMDILKKTLGYCIKSSLLGCTIGKDRCLNCNTYEEG